MLLALMLTDDSAALNMCSLFAEVNVPCSKMLLCPSTNTWIKGDWMLRAVCFWIVFGKGRGYFPVDLCATFKVHICAKHTWEGNQVTKHAIGCPVVLRLSLSSRRQGEAGICGSSTASTHTFSLIANSQNGEFSLKSFTLTTLICVKHKFQAS